MKSYETIPAGEVQVGDELRQKVWNSEAQSTEFAYQRVLLISDGGSSRWITFEGGARIRPRHVTKVQRKRPTRPAVGLKTTPAEVLAQQLNAAGWPSAADDIRDGIAAEVVRSRILGIDPDADLSEVAWPS